MNKKIVLGSILAVVILVLMSFSPSITANVSNPDKDMVEEDVIQTPIVLVLQLITKLRNHKDIQNVESEDELLQIIEGDEELNIIFETLKSFDCGCEVDEYPLDGRYPFICLLLAPFGIISILLWISVGILWFGQIVYDIGSRFNCNWA